MKRLVYILLLIPFLSFGQQSNVPETVFPMVEQFISEAHAKGIPTYHKIREVDSIAMEKLPYPLSGLHLKGSTYESVTIHQDHKRSLRSIQKSFYHEVGHVFGLIHVNTPRAIMNSNPYDLWFENETNWQKAKDEFFEQLKTINPLKSNP